MGWTATCAPNATFGGMTGTVQRPATVVARPVAERGVLSVPGAEGAAHRPWWDIGLPRVSGDAEGLMVALVVPGILRC